MRYRPMLNGDYTIGRSFLTQAAAVRQAIYTRLKLLQAEWWEQQDDGLPLFQNILGSRGHPDNLQAVDLLVHARIIETPHVSQISDFRSSYDNRMYSFECRVETDFGETISVSMNLGMEVS